MKTKLAVIALAALMAAPAFASVNCNTIAETAESMMSLRQLGGDMSEVITMINSSGLAGKTLTATQDILIGAYSMPRYGSDAMQKNAVTEYRNAIYLQCVKASR